MNITFEDSVIDASDENGRLSYGDASRLLRQHGFTIEDMYADSHDVCPVALDERKATAILNWLGY